MSSDHGKIDTMDASLHESSVAAHCDGDQQSSSWWRWRRSNGLHASTSYTCLQCRAESSQGAMDWSAHHRTFWRAIALAGMPRVIAAHMHEWSWCGGETTRYLTGKMASCGRRHPIWGLPPDVQLQFMRTAQHAELEAFWRTMKSAPKEAAGDHDLDESSIKPSTPCEILLLRVAHTFQMPPRPAPP